MNTRGRMEAVTGTTRYDTERITMSHSSALTHRLAVFAFSALLAGCASLSSPPESASNDWSRAELALRTANWEAARQPLSRLTQQDLRNGPLQFLHALSVEQQARAGDQSQLEMAVVGYQNALRFAPAHYWSLLQLGFLELERGDYGSAQARFAKAVMDQPSRWEAFYGLGVASYYRRDLPVLHLAAKRMLQLAPESADSLRLASLSMAAQGEPEAADLATRAAALDKNTASGAHLIRRVADYVDGAAAGAQFQNASAEASAAPMSSAPEFLPPPPASKQVVVEVTILLSSMLDQESRGVNLFDGLQVLYGYTNTLSQTISSIGRDSTRTITSAISTPQLNYSLNLFNDSGQYYSVVARPSITAYVGRESQFFAGRTLNVEVSGVNLGQLQPIDVGVRLRVTPEVIEPGKVTFQVAAERSFLSRDQIGSFESSLTTFRQSVSATADIEFGQTLVLSALSEQVSDRSFSRVPYLGRVPVINWPLSNSTDAQRQESLLILVTPKLPLNFSTPDDPQSRERAVQELIGMWNERIDPRTDVSAIIKRLQRSRWLRAPEPGDLRSRLPQTTAWQLEAIEESLLLARQ